MKTLAASILTCLTLSVITVFAFTAARRESCSCTADDRSCSASVSCAGACVSFCPSNGCRAMCTKAGSGGGEYADLMMRISLRLNGSDGRSVSAELARISGRDVVFVPATPDATFSLDVKDVPLWDVLERLSAGGRLQIGGDDFSNLQTVRKALLGGERMSVCVRGATVRRLVYELEYLTGLDMRVTSGDQRAAVDYTATGVTLDEIVAQVSERAGVRIAVR
jgi:hypothetical protein